MNRTCSAHSKYECKVQECEEEFRRRRRQQDDDDAAQAAASTMNTMNTILAIEIATGLL